MDPAREQVVTGSHACLPDPGVDRFSGRRRDLELNRAMRLPLHDGSP